ncbi:MAG: hypothetical protein KDJ65_01915 [Anaerolineae bacterium]|nr:hypothetical protein [Anaerolineae bacterium]
MSKFRTLRNRDASSTVRGYVYQVDLTIEKWLKLQPEEILELECGEDIDLISPLLTVIPEEEQRLLEQIKQRERPITLRSDEAIEALANFLEHRKSNPSIELIFQYTTSAKIGKEQKSPMTDKMAAIVAWENIRTGIWRNPDDPKFKKALDGIWRILHTKQKPQSVPQKTWQIFRDFLEESDREKLLEVIRKFIWNTNTRPASDMRLRIQQLLVDNRYASSETEAEAQYPRLFLYIFKLLSKSDEKQLTVKNREEQLALPWLDNNTQELLDTLMAKLVNVTTVEQLFSNNPAYENIETLYVPPLEFETIKSVLQEKNMVCIVGEPHMGKTFTAVYLLLSYYRQGYHIHLMGNDNRISIAGRYSWSDYDKDDLRKFIQPGQITYIDDPYGATEEDFKYAQERFDLKILLDAVQSNDNDHQPPKLIVTMRRSVFERVVQDTPQIRQLILDIYKGTSYDEESRRIVLSRYINFLEPKWASDNPIMQTVLETAPNKLVAPHNIYWFVDHSKDHEKLNDVLLAMKNAKEIVPALASEINHLSSELDQLVFVTMYITDFKPGFQRFPHMGLPGRNCFNHYQIFAEALGHNDPEKVLQRFKATLANWSAVFMAIGLKSIGTESQHIAGAVFQHPSFAEATAQFIEKSKTKGVFAELCLQFQKLIFDAQTYDSAMMLVHPLFRHFECLRPAVLDQTQESFRTGEKFAQRTIVEALLANYHQLPSQLQPFFDELDPENDKEIWYMFMKAAWPNPNLLVEQRIELWRRALIGGVVYPPNPLSSNLMDGPFLYYRRLPSELQKIILAYFELRNQYGWYCVAYALLNNYNYLPEELQEWFPILASEGDEYVVYQIMSALRSNYEGLPTEVQALVVDFGTDENWKYRAYIAQMFWHKTETLRSDHAKLVIDLALQDQDSRVRLSVVYSRLVLASLQKIEEMDSAYPSKIFNSLFYSEYPEDKAGVLFSIFDTARFWNGSREAEVYRRRFADLVASTEPIVIAMMRYKLQEDYPSSLPPLPPITLPETELSQYKSEVESLTSGLVSVNYGPGH